MKNSIVIMYAIVILASQTVFAQQRTIEEKITTSIQHLETALNMKKFSEMENDISEDFSYGDLQCGGHCNSAKQIMDMIVSDYPYKIQDIVVNTIESEGPDYNVSTTFLFDDKEKADQMFVMSAEGKFIEMELPRIKIITPGSEDQS